MTTKILPASLLLFFFMAIGSMSAQVPADDTQKARRPNIYDESADGSKQISDALVIAKKENKHVLLQFGADWCGWCHKLHTLFESDKSIAEKLKREFVIVLVDVDDGHNEEVDRKYGNPTRFGLPVIVILDADGKSLTTKDTAELEDGDHHHPEKVMRFLKEWGPTK